MKPETRNTFLELCNKSASVESLKFLTSHARVLLRIARHPGARLRDIAASLGITERSAHAIVADLLTAGYLVKHKHGRRNRYQIQAHLPLPEPASQEPAIGDVLAMFAGERVGQNLPGSPPDREQAVINDGNHEECRGTS
jgi:MarR family